MLFISLEEASNPKTAAERVSERRRQLGMASDGPVIAEPTKMDSPATNSPEQAGSTRGRSRRNAETTQQQSEPPESGNGQRLSTLFLHMANAVGRKGFGPKAAIAIARSRMAQGSIKGVAAPFIKSSGKPQDGPVTTDELTLRGRRRDDLHNQERGVREKDTSIRQRLGL